MYRCPKCNIELSGNARFCNNCGFNQMQTRMMDVPATPAIPATSIPSTLPDTPVPTLPQGYPSLPKRALDTGDLPTLLEEQPVLEEQPGSGISLGATSRAAEQWRNSWRDRQRAEAGPAVDVSRGHSAVAEPLLAIQQSLVRIRAVIRAEKEQGSQQKKKSKDSWLPLVMMLCLIGGLAAYIISTYLSGTHLANATAHVSTMPQPRLTAPDAQGTLATNGAQLSAGQTLHVHGEQFGAYAHITFLFNTTPLDDTNGKPMIARSNSGGAFDATLVIPATELAGEYTLQALNVQTGQHAFLDVQIVPRTPTNSTTLAFSAQAKAISNLAFTTVVGTPGQPGQTIKLTNNSNTTIQWTATAITNDNLSWLVLNNSSTSGQLNAQGSDSIGISVLADGLKSSTQPYMGDIIFTVANQGQAILPVTLQVQGKPIELLVTPNPLIAGTASAGTCLPNTTLTIINLNDTVISWEIKPDNSDTQQHIALNGQAFPAGVLQPFGSAHDTTVLKLSCSELQIGKAYAMTIYYNGMAQHISIIARWVP